MLCEIENLILDVFSNKEIKRRLVYLYSHRYGTLYNFHVDTFFCNGTHEQEDKKVYWNQVLMKRPVNDIQYFVYKFWLDENDKSFVKSPIIPEKGNYTEEEEYIDSGPEGLWYLLFDIQRVSIKIQERFFKPFDYSKPKKGTSWINLEKEIVLSK